MKKMLAAVLASVTLGVASLAPTAPAHADSAGAAVAAGIGGFALGAMTGGAMPAPRRPSITAPLPLPMSKLPIAGASADRCSTKMAKWSATALAVFASKIPDPLNLGLA